ncbi:MarR family winged helix-turn-helix transcriptional regulator [Nocardia vinacea]|uniref:MarR family winged helix-turn-helix transcriptional regulator n=1 Tax=Nocardia vinacea TaxID=96468 RepID=UPI0034401FBA
MDVSAARNRETADGGPALFRLVRFWSRRWINQARTDTAAAPDDLRQVQHIQVVEAIAAGRRTSDEATVSTVAEQLGVDHSGASRMVRDAAAAGYLTRIDSAHDRRRVVLELTADGRDLLTASHDWQRRYFDRLTASWPERDRRQFAAYLQRLADEATHNGAE